MRLTPDIGTANTNGVIKPTADPDVHVRLIEWHARKGNTGNAYAGVSDVSTTNGRELVPGEQVTWDFSNMGANNEPGYVLFSTLYVAFSAGGDQLDWTIFTTDD